MFGILILCYKLFVMIMNVVMILEVTILRFYITISLRVMILRFGRILRSML